MKLTRWTAAILAALSFQAALAESQPKHSVHDGRIQMATYRSDDVFPVLTKVGEAILIELEADERLSGDNALIGMGDTAAWNLAAKGRNIIFKPIAPQPDTNLLVVTNKRTYAFRLKTATDRQKPTYILRFRYPDTEAANTAKIIEQQNKVRLAMAGIPQKQPEQDANLNYWARGDKDLAPTAAWDNGRFTYFQFDNARALPAMYRIEADGSETLLNTHIEGNTVVIHETSRNFVFRLGKSVLGVENRRYDDTGRFNRTGTDSPETIRISIGDTQ